MSFDGKVFAGDLTEIVKGYVDRANAPLMAENKALAERIAVLEARPAPEKGDKGDSIKGEPGVGLAGAVIDRTGGLILTLSDGTTRELGVVVGKDGTEVDLGELERSIDKKLEEAVAAIPKPKDGVNGFNLDDFNIERGADGRTLILKFDRGEDHHEYELTFPVPVYCGVFKEGDEYVPGDLVTWGGSLWHCDAPTKDKPSPENWTLAVKKGRDGKDMKNG